VPTFIDCEDAESEAGKTNSSVSRTSGGSVSSSSAEEDEVRALRKPRSSPTASPKIAARKAVRETVAAEDKGSREDDYSGDEQDLTPLHMPARIASRPSSSSALRNTTPPAAERKKELATPSRTTVVHISTPTAEEESADESVSDAVSTPSQWSAEDYYADYRVSEESKSQSGDEGFDAELAAFEVGAISEDYLDHAQGSDLEAEQHAEEQDESHWTHEPDVGVRVENVGSEEQGSYDSADDMSIALSSDSNKSNSYPLREQQGGAEEVGGEYVTAAPSSHWTVSDVTAED
jgi:hypothetical protein